MSLLPIISFLAVIVYVLLRSGAESAQGISQYALLGAAALAVVLSKFIYRRKWKYIVMGIRMSSKQIFPTFIILVLIGTVSATWMMSGTVPALIDLSLIHI